MNMICKKKKDLIQLKNTVRKKSTVKQLLSWSIGTICSM